MNSTINSQRLKDALASYWWVIYLWIALSLAATCCCLYDPLPLNLSFVRLPVFLVPMLLGILLTQWLTVPYGYRSLAFLLNVSLLAITRALAHVGWEMELMAYVVLLLTSGLGFISDWAGRADSWHTGGNKGLYAVLEDLTEPVVLVKHHTIISLNRAALAALGYASGVDLAGKDVSVLMDEPEASIHHQFIQRYEKTGEAKIIGRPRVVNARHRDGSRVSVLLSVSALCNRGEYIAIMYRRYHHATK